MSSVIWNGGVTAARRTVQTNVPSSPNHSSMTMTGLALVRSDDVMDGLLDIALAPSNFNTAAAIYFRPCWSSRNAAPSPIAYINWAGGEGLTNKAHHNAHHDKRQVTSVSLDDLGCRLENPLAPERGCEFGFT